MLSRVADSLYWCARYMERAAHTARLLDVNHHILVEPSSPLVRLRWGALVAISGDDARFARHYDLADPRNVFEFLAFRDDNPNSIVSCVRMVRENARAIRDRLPQDLWEEIHALSRTVAALRPGEELDAGPRGLCAAIESGGHGFLGAAHDTLPRDEGWHFLQAGRALERAEMTARILDVEYHQLLETASLAGNQHQWIAVLKALAAYEFYRRRYHTGIEPNYALELLLLHPEHPRSIRFNAALLEQSLRAIRGAAPGGTPGSAEAHAARMLNVLTTSGLEDILAEGIHQFLSDIERSCQLIGDQITRTFFYYTVVA
jgi:uncharacterized alpha-E superfamily protein